MRLSHKRKIAHKQGRYHLKAVKLKLKNIKRISFKKAIKEIIKNFIANLHFFDAIAPMTK